MVVLLDWWQWVWRFLKRKKTKLFGGVDLFTLMEMCMEENRKKIQHMKISICFWYNFYFNFWCQAIIEAVMNLKMAYIHFSICWLVSEFKGKGTTLVYTLIALVLYNHSIKCKSKYGCEYSCNWGIICFNRIHNVTIGSSPTIGRISSEEASIP